MDNITGMSIQEYAAMRELECEHKKGWGSTTALWVIAAVIVIAFFVYSWHNSCNERTQFAVGLANLTGRVNCMEPDVRWTGQQLYAANGEVDMIPCILDQIFIRTRKIEKENAFIRRSLDSMMQDRNTIQLAGLSDNEDKTD